MRSEEMVRWRLNAMNSEVRAESWGMVGSWELGLKI